MEEPESVRLLKGSLRASEDSMTRGLKDHRYRSRVRLPMTVAPLDSTTRGLKGAEVRGPSHEGSDCTPRPVVQVLVTLAPSRKETNTCDTPLR